MITKLPITPQFVKALIDAQERRATRSGVIGLGP
jgi:hypothetical protein